MKLSAKVIEVETTFPLREALLPQYKETGPKDTTGFFFQELCVTRAAS